MDKKFLGLHGLEETREFSKLKNINSKFAKENCYNILMKIIPGLIENDFDPFVEGIQKIQENMSKIFYGKKYNYSSENISRIFNFLKHENHLGFGQSSWGPSSFIFCKNKTKRDELLNKMENFIELKKIEGINFIMVKGRNFGNNKKRINDD
jgi:predicted sugar kinase